MQKKRFSLPINYFRKFFSYFLTYRGIRWGYIILFLLLFYNAMNVLDFSSHSQQSQNKVFSLKSKSDFGDYYEASLNLRNKEDLYYTDKIDEFTKEIKNQKELTLETIIPLLAEIRGVGTYLYPPFFAFILIPLSFFNYNFAAFLYQMIQIFLLIISLYLLYRMGIFLSLSKRRVLFIILFSLFLYLPFHIQNLSNGNVGEILVFFIVLSLYLYFLHKSNFYKFLNGILLGIVIMIKLLPGFIVGYYFIKKEYKIIVGSIIGFFIALILPAIFLGWNENIQLFIKWFDLIIKNFQKYVAIRPYANNQTISAMFAKYFLPFADLKQYIYGLPFQISFLTKETVIIIIKISNVIVLGIFSLITFLGFIKNLKEKIQYPFMIQYIFLAFLVALLTSGISWYHSYIMLFPIIVIYFFIHKNAYKRFRENHLYLILGIYVWFYSILPNILRDLLSLYSIFTIISIYILINLFYKNIKILFNRSEFGI